MSNIAFLNKPFIQSGLGTITHTIQTAGLFNVKVEATELPPSGLSFDVQLNGVSQFTSPVITPSQIAIQFKTKPIICVSTDVINVVISSVETVDAEINNVKVQVIIEEGI